MERERFGVADPVADPARLEALDLDRRVQEGLADVDGDDAGAAVGDEPGVVALASADVEPAEPPDVGQHPEEGRRVHVVPVDVVAGA